jgi:hypothetical protein
MTAAPLGASERGKVKSRPDPWVGLTTGSTSNTEGAAMAKSGFAAIGFKCPDCMQKYNTPQALSLHHTHFHQDFDRPHVESECVLDALARKNPDSDTGATATAKKDDGAVGTKGGGTPIGKFQCADCIQQYNSERALSVHRKWIHTGTEMNVGYELRYEFDNSALASDKPVPASDKSAHPGDPPAVAHGNPPPATQQQQSKRRPGVHDPRDPFWRNLSDTPARSKL